MTFVFEIIQQPTFLPEIVDLLFTESHVFGTRNHVFGIFTIKVCELFSRNCSQIIVHFVFIYLFIYFCNPLKLNLNMFISFRNKLKGH